MGTITGNSLPRRAMRHTRGRPAVCWLRLFGKNEKFKFLAFLYSSKTGVSPPNTLNITTPPPLPTATSPGLFNFHTVYYLFSIIITTSLINIINQRFCHRPNRLSNRERATKKKKKKAAKTARLLELIWLWIQQRKKVNQTSVRKKDSEEMVVGEGLGGMKGGYERGGWGRVDERRKWARKGWRGLVGGVGVMGRRERTSCI